MLSSKAFIAAIFISSVFCGLNEDYADILSGRIELEDSHIEEIFERF